MKICIILPHFYPYIGGGEKMFYDLAKGYVVAGHEVRVIARSVGDEYIGKKIINGIEVYYYPWKSIFGHPIPNKQDMKQHVKWCDVVHTSIFTTARPVSRLARKYEKPSIFTVYEVRGTKWYWVENVMKATAFFLFEQYTCRTEFQMYHTISDASKNDYLQYCGKRDVRRVYLAADEMDTSIADTSEFDINEFFEVDKNNRIFLFYGRPGQTKGIYVYLDAIHKLKMSSACIDQIKFCFLLGAEPSELFNKFQKEVIKRKLDDIIIICKSIGRNDLCKCILQADYVVVPSVTEGFGLSALEACQMGKKLIYSDGGSLPEVVYGSCVAFHNRDAKDLQEKLTNVIESPDNAFEEIPEKTFSYEVMVNGMLELYKELITK